MSDVETSPGSVGGVRGDSHLHTHVIVPNRQARDDGVLVSTDWTSPYHGPARGHLSDHVAPRVAPPVVGILSASTEIAGFFCRDDIRAWSRRSSQLREWPAHNLVSVYGPLSAAHLTVAQKSHASRQTGGAGLGAMSRHATHLRAPPRAHRCVEAMLAQCVDN